MTTSLPRVQVTVDPELAAAIAEFDGASKSQAIRDLALRGAETLREERARRDEALQFFRELSEGKHDDRYDWSVSAELHANRR